MFLEKIDEIDTSIMSIEEKMNLLLKTMESEGIFFISCNHCNIAVKEAEQWYEHGKMGNQDYIISMKQ